MKFLVGTRLSLKFIKKNLDDVYDDIRMFNNYDDSIATYGYTVSTEWNYIQEIPYKGDTIRDKRRMYIPIITASKRLMMMNRLLTRELHVCIRNCLKISWLKVTKRLMNSSSKLRTHRSVDVRLITKKMP